MPLDLSPQSKTEGRRTQPPLFYVFLFSLELFLVVLCANVLASPAAQSFTGMITDDICDHGDHSQMKMGDTAHDCTIACVVGHGASYVLFDGKNVYALSDQKTPEKFAGQKVTVLGALDAKTKTIQVTSIAAAK